MESASDDIEPLENPPTTTPLVMDASLGLDKDDDVDNDNTSCVRFLEEKGIWEPLIRFIKLFIHFAVVILSLFGAAVFLAEVEDPAASMTLPNTTRSERVLSLCDHLQTQYNLTINPDNMSSLIEKLNSYEAEEENIAYRLEHQERRRVFFKWFYYVTITATTIGYGDISPKTETGKLFCIGFAVIGVIMMTTLIFSFGTVISDCHQMFHSSIISCVCRRRNKIVSEQLFSCITVILLFLIFLFIVIWYGQYGMKYSTWSLLDACYYWIITFTTVGYGDLTYSIDIEIKYFLEHIVFRIVGLAFLASIVDAISDYCNYRKKLLMAKKVVVQRTLSEFRAGMEKGMAMLERS